MSWINTILRVLLGLVFFVFGLNGFLHFIPTPPMPDAPKALMGAFANSGYLLTLISGTQVVAGALLLTGYFVPLALTILAPIVVNIFFFHLFLARDGLGIAIVVVAIEVYLAWVHREAFRPLLQAR